ncbi:hypothetical protein NUTIK01_26250 [Novosphingobium sp. IK01]|uniref:Uncharacterized protein n=1 Tax=Novosphingobium pituita TaxID=3056842 RepID=A0ABQ6P996_9SPHN|nr:hypothetical protein NUTIK01_26250 [Novosphingobium sp. IK01]
MMPGGKGETSELGPAGGVAIEDVECDTFDHRVEVTTLAPCRAMRESFVLNTSGRFHRGDIPNSLRDFGSEPEPIIQTEFIDMCWFLSHATSMKTGCVSNICKHD